MKNFILTIIATIALISCNNTKEKEAQVNENEPKEEVKTNKKPVDSMKIRYADAGLNKQYLENIQKSNKRAAIEEVYNWEELKILNDDILALEENRSLEPTVIEQLNQDAEAVRNSVPTLVSTSKVEDAILEIAKKAINKKTGARGLRSILESLLLKTMFKLPTMVDVEEVIINETVVRNTQEPIFIHSKTKKTSAA